MTVPADQQKVGLNKEDQKLRKAMFGGIFLAVIGLCLSSIGANYLVSPGTRYDQAMEALSEAAKTNNTAKMKELEPVLNIEKSKQCLFNDCILLTQLFIAADKQVPAYYFIERSLQLAKNPENDDLIMQQIPNVLNLREESDSLSKGLRKEIIVSGFISRKNSQLLGLLTAEQNNVSRNMFMLCIEFQLGTKKDFTDFFMHEMSRTSETEKMHSITLIKLLPREMQQQVAHYLLQDPIVNQDSLITSFLREIQ